MTPDEARSLLPVVLEELIPAWRDVLAMVQDPPLDLVQMVKDRYAAGCEEFSGDWTTRDERITQALAQFGRNGVPLYVLYDTKGQPTVLPEILTEGTVLAALDRIKLAAR
jgi:thiol:disulfide interchange protein DsbD